MFDPQYPGECSNLTNYKERVKKKSYIRKEKYCPATTTAMYVMLRLPPLDSETGGLKSSGQKIISSFGGTKKIAVFFCKFVSFLIFLKLFLLYFFEIFRFEDHLKKQNCFFLVTLWIFIDFFYFTFLI